MRKIFLLVLAAGFIGFAVFLFITMPKTVDPALMAGLTGDAKRGEQIFHQGGCASCHAAPKAKEDEKNLLGGGQRFPSPFGTFVAPNISPDPETGIGGWSDSDMVNAMQLGASPDRQHYFPVFPYTSYARTRIADIVDLKAFLDTLPPVSRTNEAHDVPFPFNIRRTLGGWKRLFLSEEPVIDTAGQSDEVKRGQYLVEGFGHCSECHTARNVLGGVVKDRWMGGAPNPVGRGTIPNITAHKDGLGWSEGEIVEYLTSGFTPEFDTAGGTMVEVIENTAKMSAEDRQAIAAYLKFIPAVAKP